MSDEKRKKRKMKLPDGVVLPEGVELPEIEVCDYILRTYHIGEDGEMYEIEKIIELPIIKSKE